ncbi:MAG: hypothetical protein A2W23_06965 [Planctomycetes bacterium RBG_16_43_13]|nr:MAG: hypothetical protein A2W23_06965 [Planctomycetes bacterium RBG_16_43_13]
MKENQNFEDIVRIASSDTEKASRIISRSFYKVLRRNGFTDDQIISVASNILGCLIEGLEGYKEKKGRKEEVLDEGYK